MVARPFARIAGVRAVFVLVATLTAHALASGVAGAGSAAAVPPQAAPIWTAATGSAASPPVVADGVVYVSTEKGPLFAFDANCATEGRTCTPLWTGNTG